MARATKEFSKKVRLDAWQKSGGKCAKCTVRLSPSRFHYDHIIPMALGGESVSTNIQVVCDACHQTKTGTVDIPTIAKSNRVRSKHLGLGTKRRSLFPGARTSRWKKKVNGMVVLRDE
jgi:5-methylcytosine-specific restriction endonuclease McrA